MAQLEAAVPTRIKPRVTGPTNAGRATCPAFKARPTLIAKSGTQTRGSTAFSSSVLASGFEPAELPNARAIGKQHSKKNGVYKSCAYVA